MSALYSLERSGDNNDDYEGTNSEDNNCYGNGDGGGDSITCARRGFTEWLGFLSPSELSETFGSMEEVKAPSSTKPRKTRSWEEVRIK